MKKNKGITLIALVVTIIVLLILAGISINMLTGQNGILKRAIEAKKNTEDSSDLEYLRTKGYEGVTEYYLDGKTGSETEYILQKLNELDGVTTNLVQETVTYNGKTYDISQITGSSNEKNAIESQKELTQITAANATREEDKKLLAENDENGNAKLRMIIVEEKNGNETVKAVIPSGFYYVTGTPTTGLVISDKYGDDNNNSKGGNQFVWVPCNGGEAVYEKHVYETDSIDDSASISDSGNEMWATCDYRNWSDWKDDDDRINKNASIKKYGGFYVGRYEAGIPKEADFYNDKDKTIYWQSNYDEDTSKIYGDNDFKIDANKTYADTYKIKDVTVQNGKNLIPVSDKNNPSWNYISQKNAIIVSNNMYNESKTVKSYLIDGVAWDTLCKWISNDEKDKKDVVDSTKWGNYFNSKYQITGLYAKHQWKEGATGTFKWFPAYFYQKGIYEKEDEITEIATGSSERNMAKRIYDLAGNMWEWTTEVGDHTKKENNENKQILGNYAVLRGGSIKSNGEAEAISHRSGDYPCGSANFFIGFRVVIYIKI